MVRRLAVTFSLMFAIGSFAVTLTSQSAGNRAEIDAFYGQSMGTAAKQGPAAYASFYLDDGMVLPPNERPAIGGGASEEFQRRAQAESPYAVKPTGINVDEVRLVAADWAVYRSTLSGQRIARAGGTVTPFETKYFDVLRRGVDGKWQVAYRIWSDSTK